MAHENSRESLDTPLDVVDHSPLHGGDQVFYYINVSWVAIYAVVSVLFLVALYQIIRNSWSWWGVIPIVFNVLTTFFFFPIIRLSTEIAVWLGAVDLTVMFFSGLVFMVYVMYHSRLMGVLMIPYFLWSAYFCVIMWEVVRLY